MVVSLHECRSAATASGVRMVMGFRFVVDAQSVLFR